LETDDPGESDAHGLPTRWTLKPKSVADAAGHPDGMSFERFVDILFRGGIDPIGKPDFRDSMVTSRVLDCRRGDGKNGAGLTGLPVDESIGFEMTIRNWISV
jgi:hypothetical protein